MRKRSQEFALSLHSEKTRLIEFGRFAAANRKRRGLGKPETFTFLGKMVAAGRHRLLQLPRGADERSSTDRIPLPRHQSLAAHATAAECVYSNEIGRHRSA
jgi:hypothetical protein